MEKQIKREKMIKKKSILKILLIIILIPVTLVHVHIWFFILASYMTRDSIAKKMIMIPYSDNLIKSIRFNDMFEASVSDTSEIGVLEFVIDSLLSSVIEEAEGCGPCQKAYPAFKKYANRKKGKYAFIMHFTPADENGMWNLSFPVDLKAYPTLVRYRDGKVIANVNGTYNIADYMSKI